ncbi:MAG: exopolysaccharide biosynthesis polyprenyl glycosylphosphotransferase [Crocinitomicaceae bacterium]
MNTKKISTELIRILLYLSDILSLNLSILLIYIYNYNSINILCNESSSLIYNNILWIILSRIYKPYEIKRFQTSEKMLNKSFKLLLIFTLIKSANHVLLKDFENMSALIFIEQLLLFYFIASFFRIGLVYFLKLLRKKGVNSKNVLIVGINKESLRLIKLFNKDQSFGYKIIGYIDDKKNEDINLNYFGNLNEIESIIKNNNIDEIYKTINEKEGDSKEIINLCEDHFIRIKLIPNFQKHTLNRRVSTDFYKDQPIIHLRKEPLEYLINKIQKRTFDVLFSLSIILLVYPWLFPIVILLQKLTSKGPVFFIQKRSGQDNVVFGCVKFRTMFMNKESELKGTLKNDPRITPFGKLLRKTRIDELPQFINVFRGEMSVVGPRPHMLKHTEEYSKLVDEFLVRQFVKPGITGWAQTTGYIDENKKLQEMKDKVKKDVWYIENWSFILDLKIIALTILNIIRKDKNAY